MITKVFAIYDTKSLCCGQPYFMPTVGAAIRAFSDLSNDKQSNINKHPTDYMLWELGTYDDNIGKFVNLDVVKNLGLGSDYIQQTVPFANGATHEEIVEKLQSNSNSNGKKTLPEVLK